MTRNKRSLLALAGLALGADEPDWCTWTDSQSNDADRAVVRNLRDIRKIAELQAWVRTRGGSGTIGARAKAFPHRPRRGDTR